MLKTAEGNFADENVKEVFTSKCLKYASQAHEIHNRDENARWSDGNDETYDDRHILEDFMLPKTIKEMIKESESGSVDKGLESACVQTISVMTAGHAKLGRRLYLGRKK